MKKRLVLNYFSILLILAVISTSVSCSSNDDNASDNTSSNSKSYTLNFGQLDEMGRSATLLDVTFEVLRTQPLTIESNDMLQVVSGTDIANQKDYEGIMVTRDYEYAVNTIYQVKGYIFNNNTQCFMYGTWTYDTDRPGWWRFEFASAQQQVLYNQCAPEGEYYARP